MHPLRLSGAPAPFKTCQKKKQVSQLFCVNLSKSARFELHLEASGSYFFSTAVRFEAGAIWRRDTVANDGPSCC